MKLLFKMLAALVIAFLVSPLGLPMLAVRILGLLQDANYALRDFIRG